MDRAALEDAVAYVDSWLGWRLPRLDVPGCAVAVASGDELVLSGAYGWADVAAGRPMRAGSVFRVASHSKTFTAVAVMQLVEEGRLRLDDPVTTHVPWLAEHRDRRWRAVTVRHLLSHGAGVIRDGLDSDFWNLRRRFPDADALRSEVLEAELVTDPDVALKYSNFGYGVLGAVIEGAAGRPYADVVASGILAPLGTETLVVEPAPDADVVTGYGRRRAAGDRRALPPVHTGALAAATGFAGSAPEMARYMAALRVGTGQLLSDASKREMQRMAWHARRPGSGVHEDYGLGLVLEHIGDRHTFGHSGGFPGHITRTLCDPDDGLVVCVLTNCIDGPASDLARGIVGIVDAFARTPARDLPAEVTGADLRRLRGRYVSVWAAHDVVATPAGVLVGTPDSNAPLADADRLDPLDATTLRIADTGSFGSAGELVRFALADGAVDSVTWAGATMVPEARWEAEEEAVVSAAS